MAANRCLFVLDTVPCLKEMTEEPSGHTHALHAFRCPSGHRCYQTADGQAIRFRQQFGSDIWHFSAGCSQWPIINFVSNECISNEAKYAMSALLKDLRSYLDQSTIFINLIIRDKNLFTKTNGILKSYLGTVISYEDS